jgi:hypothetical protein
MKPGEEKPDSDAPTADAPDAGNLPARYGRITNLAKDSELCEKFREHAATQIQRFETQAARHNFVSKTMKTADRMWRVALMRDETNSQTKDTLSNVTSPMFHIQERAITAGEMAIFFGDNKMPVEFEPEVNTTEYNRDDGMLIAQQQNMLEEYTFDEDRRKFKLDELLHYTNKYAMQCVGIEWARESREVTENVPKISAGKLPNGQWKTIERVTKRRVVKDWPELVRVPIENTYFDAAIQEISDQRCFAYWGRAGIETLARQQKDGHVVNVEKLTRSQLYQGEVHQDSALDDRKANAGENDQMEPTGEVEVWNVFCWAPIKSERGKPKWDPDSIICELYWAQYAGDIRNSSAVCLKLCKLPHWHGEIPFKLIRSHRDDKGAFSTGYAEMIQSLYWQAVTNLNQAVDNVTERNWAPMVVYGNLITRDLTFKKNKLIEVDRMSKLERLNIPDTTQITMEMHDIVERMANQLTGADKPISAEPLGGRTSATEARNVFDQAMLPLDHKAAWMAEQIFPWMLRLDAEYWRQYGDPAQTIAITHNNTIYDVNPGDLYGPIRTKITAITRFRNNTVRRMELNSFLQNVAPIFINAMGDTGLVELGRDVFEVFGLENGRNYFPDSGDYDATARAQASVEKLLVQGVWDEPKPEENQKAFLAVLRPALRKFELLGDTPEQNLQFARLNITMREEFQQQKAQRVNPAAMLQAGGGAPGAPPEGLPGETDSNPVEAMMGAAGGGAQ